MLHMEMDDKIRENEENNDEMREEPPAENYQVFDSTRASQPWQ